MKLYRLFAGRLPDRQSVLGVYAVIVLLVYSWTLFTSFYKLPSWMFYLTPGQIASVYAYAFSVDLLESILVLAGILFLDLTIFLAMRNREEFQPRSILLVVIVLISSMVRLLVFRKDEDIIGFLSGELIWWAATALLAFLAAVFAPKSKSVRKAIGSVAERSTVFLYIYIPLSLISLAVVILRNLI